MHLMMLRQKNEAAVGGDFVLIIDDGMDELLI
jgi:hypothetical protein